MEKVQNLKSSNTAPSSKTFRGVVYLFCFLYSWMQGNCKNLAIKYLEYSRMNKRYIIEIVAEMLLSFMTVPSIWQ
jgi:hypothetical protein